MNWNKAGGRDRKKRCCATWGERWCCSEPGQWEKGQRCGLRNRQEASPEFRPRELGSMALLFWALTSLSVEWE